MSAFESGYLSEQELVRRVVVSLSPQTRAEEITREVVSRLLSQIGTPDQVRTKDNVAIITERVQQCFTQ